MRHRLASGGYLKAALEHAHYGGDEQKIIKDILQDFIFRGISDDRQISFRRRIEAMKLLLDNSGTHGRCISSAIWNTSKAEFDLSKRKWSKEQQQVLDIAEKGVAVDDANVSVHEGMLLVGAGETEAVIGCAASAAAKGERVLIACPIGALVDTYRQRLPPNENIIIETVHASHRITRKADE